jgi:hypothetical protein
MKMALIKWKERGRGRERERGRGRDRTDRNDIVHEINVLN